MAAMDPESPEGQRKRQGAPVDPWRALKALARGWVWLLASLLVGAGIGAVVYVLWPRVWETEALLAADPDPTLADSPVHRTSLAATQEVPAEAVIDGARARLSISAPRESIAARVEASVVDETSLRIRVRSSSASGAQGLANGIIAAFLEARRERERARVAERMQRAASELAVTEERLAQARQTWDAFRTEHGIADLDIERRTAIENAAELASQAEMEAVDAASAAARITELQQLVRRLPETSVQSGTREDPLQAELASARSDLDRARATLTEDHPQRQAAEARVRALEERMAQGGTATSRVELGANPVRVALEGEIATAEAARAEALERERQLRVLATEARSRVLAMSEIDAEGSELLARVRSAETQRDALSGEIGSLGDRVSFPATGFRIVVPPPLPETPVPSTARRVVPFLIPLILFLFVATVLLYRGRGPGGPKVESATEAAWWGDAPVVGTTTWPRDPAALEMLVAELEDFGVYAAGRTLVVPGTPAELEATCELAARLAEAPWLAAAVLDVEETPTTEAPPPPSVRPLRIPGRRETLPMPLLARDTLSATRVTTPALELPPERPTRVRMATVRIARDSAPPDAPRVSRVPDDRPTQPGHDGGVVPVPAPVVVFGAPKVLVGAGVSAQGMVRVGEGSTPVVKAEVLRSKPTPIGGIARDMVVLPPGSTGQARPAAQPGSESVVSSRGVVITGNVTRVGDAPVSVVQTSSVSQASSASQASSTQDMRPIGIEVSVSGPAVIESAIHIEESESGEQAVMMLAMRILRDDVAQLAVRDPVLTATPVVPQKTKDKEKEQAVVLAWNGPLAGPTLRRAARLSDRVLVVVREGAITPQDMATLRDRLGRDDAIGFLMIGIADSEVSRRDRIGDVREFWTARRRKES